MQRVLKFISFFQQSKLLREYLYCYNSRQIRPKLLRREIGQKFPYHKYNEIFKIVGRSYQVRLFREDGSTGHVPIDRVGGRGEERQLVLRLDRLLGGQLR